MKYTTLGIEWEESTHTMGKIWVPISQVLRVRWLLLHFPILRESDEKTHAFPIRWSIYHKMGKKYPYYGKSMITNFPGFLIRWVLLHFPILWEIDGKTHAFSIWWSIPQHAGIGWEKSTHIIYYGKSMITNFPGSPHKMGFVAFSHAMGNWWENPYISHTIRFVNFFLSKEKW